MISVRLEPTKPSSKKIMWDHEQNMSGRAMVSVEAVAVQDAWKPSEDVISCDINIYFWVG